MSHQPAPQPPVDETDEEWAARVIAERGPIPGQVIDWLKGKRAQAS